MSKTQRDTELVARYAKALFASAQAKGALEAVEGDVKEIQSLFAASETLGKFVRSPLFSRGDQAKGITAVLEKAGVSVLTQQFCALLAENRRLALLAAIGEAFLSLLSEARGEITVEVTSATALEEKALATLRTQLENALGKKLRLKKAVDAKILGGLIVKIGSTMLDDSLRSKLERLQRLSKNAIASL